MSRVSPAEAHSAPHNRHHRWCILGAQAPQGGFGGVAGAGAAGGVRGGGSPPLGRGIIKKPGRLLHYRWVFVGYVFLLDVIFLSFFFIIFFVVL